MQTYVLERYREGKLVGAEYIQATPEAISHLKPPEGFEYRYVQASTQEQYEAEKRREAEEEAKKQLGTPPEGFTEKVEWHDGTVTVRHEVDPAWVQQHGVPPAIAEALGSAPEGFRWDVTTDGGVRAELKPVEEYWKGGVDTSRLTPEQRALFQNMSEGRLFYSRERGWYVESPQSKFTFTPSLRGHGSRMPQIEEEFRGEYFQPHLPGSQGGTVTVAEGYSVFTKDGSPTGEVVPVDKRSAVGSALGLPPVGTEMRLNLVGKTLFRHENAPDPTASTADYSWMKYKGFGAVSGAGSIATDPYTADVGPDADVMPVTGTILEKGHAWAESMSKTEVQLPMSAIATFTGTVTGKGGDAAVKPSEVVRGVTDFTAGFVASYESIYAPHLPGITNAAQYGAFLKQHPMYFVGSAAALAVDVAFAAPAVVRSTKWAATSLKNLAKARVYDFDVALSRSRELELSARRAALAEKFPEPPLGRGVQPATALDAGDAYEIPGEIEKFFEPKQVRPVQPAVPRIENHLPPQPKHAYDFGGPVQPSILDVNVRGYGDFFARAGIPPATDSSKFPQTGTAVGIRMKGTGAKYRPWTTSSRSGSVTYFPAEELLLPPEFREVVKAPKLSSATPPSAKGLSGTAVPFVKGGASAQYLLSRKAVETLLSEDVAYDYATGTSTITQLSSPGISGIHAGAFRITRAQPLGAKGVMQARTVWERQAARLSPAATMQASWLAPHHAVRQTTAQGQRALTATNTVGQWTATTQATAQAHASTQPVKVRHWEERRWVHHKKMRRWGAEVGIEWISLPSVEALFGGKGRGKRLKGVHG